VDFPEDDLQLIARLILFLYTGYLPSWSQDSQEQEGCPAPTMRWMGSLRKMLRPSEDVFINCFDEEIYEQDHGESMATVVLLHALAVKLDVLKLEMEARMEYLIAKTRLPYSKCVGGRGNDFLNSLKLVYQKTLDTDRIL
jgi:hypothetical protein